MQLLQCDLLQAQDSFRIQMQATSRHMSHHHQPVGHHNGGKVQLSTWQLLPMSLLHQFLEVSCLKFWNQLQQLHNEVLNTEVKPGSHLLHIMWALSSKEVCRQMLPQVQMLHQVQMLCHSSMFKRLVRIC